MAGSDVPVLAGVGVSAPSEVTVVCEDVPSDSEWDFLEPQSFSFSKKRNFACVAGQDAMNYEGTPVKAPLCPKRRMITPLPQQSCFASMEEESRWSAQERTAAARMEQYVNNSDVLKLEIAEEDENSLGPECSHVDVKHIVRNATREGRNIFESFSVREKGEHLVASKWRWDDSQKQRRPQKEIDWKESQSPEVDRRVRNDSFQSDPAFMFFISLFSHFFHFLLLQKKIRFFFFFDILFL